MNIRASMLAGYSDCVRRTVAKSYGRKFEKLGYVLRQLPPSVGAAAGTAVHHATADQIHQMPHMPEARHHGFRLDRRDRLRRSSRLPVDQGGYCMDSGGRGRAGCFALVVYRMTTTVTFNGENLEVDFDYQPPCRGARDSYGVPLEPDDPESVEINTVTFKGVDITFLLESRFDEIEEKIFEAMSNAAESAAEARAEAEYERILER